MAEGHGELSEYNHSAGAERRAAIGTDKRAIKRLVKQSNCEQHMERIAP